MAEPISETPGMSSGPTLSIEVRFDLICPWCLIGKRHLDTALDMLRGQQADVTVEVAWRSYPLMPGIPNEGLPFAAFYLQRLGSPEAVALRQAQVREAARAAGVDIAFDRIAVFPNSLEAHRVVAQAQHQGGSTLAGTVIDALFECYFTQGRNIGDAEVLADVQAACGIYPGEAAEPDAQEKRGSHGVPYFRLNDTFVIEGAQRPTVLLDAMLRAHSSRLGTRRA
jgi:predicted DsbA family dithiol-disulfide isomerase